MFILGFFTGVVFSGVIILSFLSYHLDKEYKKFLNETENK